MNSYWHSRVPFNYDEEYELEEPLTERSLNKFTCQKEVAAGKLYRYFLGKNNSPKTKLGKQTTGLNTVRSRDIENIIFWRDAYNNKNKTINGFPIKPNGQIKVKDNDSTQYKKFKNLASVGIVAWFLGELDLHDKNFGVVERGNKFVVQKIDHEGSLCDPIFDSIFFPHHEAIFNGNFDCVVYNEVRFPKEIITSSRIISESFKAIYNIIYSDSIEIDNIIDKAIGDEFEVERKRIRKALKERRQSLRAQANTDPSFLLFQMLHVGEITSVNFKPFSNDPFQDYTLMDYAIETRNSAMILSLLNNGADITMKRHGSNIPIHSELVALYADPKNSLESKIRKILKVKERELGFKFKKTIDSKLPLFGYLKSHKEVRDHQPISNQQLLSNRPQCNISELEDWIRCCDQYSPFYEKSSKRKLSCEGSSSETTHYHDQELNHSNKFKMN